MTDLTPNHPAVLAALNAETQRQRTRVDAYADDHIREMLDALTAALLHLTADDLRHTPVGRELMAEAWDQGYLAGEDDARLLREAEECYPNPYLEGDA